MTKSEMLKMAFEKEKQKKEWYKRPSTYMLAVSAPLIGLGAINIIRGARAFKKIDDRAMKHDLKWSFPQFGDPVKLEAERAASFQSIVDDAEKANKKYNSPLKQTMNTIGVGSLAGGLYGTWSGKY